MNKVKYFEKTAEYLCKLLKIYPDIFVKQDNRLKSYCASIQRYTYVDTHEDCYLLKYNAKEIILYPKWQLIKIILHELAHLVLGHCKCFNITRIDREYRAEKLALLWIKRYYPKYYKRNIAYLQKYKNHTSKIYKEAYTKLWREFK